ncbi:MAG TPA: hypothetical protein VD930_00700 [Gemmatimonadales bacterium]|nr:hypothetical protein [Gemmatimonadales bacterium]
MLRSLAAIAMALTLCGTTSGSAQTETVLKEYFEGRTVSPKMAMPGTEEGVDVYPGSPRPLDYSRYADRLKDYGTAIRPGEPVIVTKVRLKSKHIEFQLGGGGYGTFGDETSSNVSVPPAPVTKREKNLEAELKRETDPGRKRALKEELDELKSAREREDARNRSALAEAQEHRKENIRQRRREGGSRFNLRYADRVPREALTPEAVMTALRQYVDFGELAGGQTASASNARPAGGLRKGMLLEEVDATLGNPVSNTERREGRFRVNQRSYSSSMGQVSAEFVEGVLIRYTVTSE